MTSSVDAATFRRALGSFASGVTVVSVRDAAGVDHGMTVSAFSSVSLDPPLVSVCIGHEATCAPQIAAATHLGVSILGAAQAAISQRFAESGSDRFEGIAVQRGESGVPLVAGALAHAEARIVARHAAGDHTIVVAELLLATAAAGEPLVYFRGQYGRIVTD